MVAGDLGGADLVGDVVAGVGRLTRLRRRVCPDWLAVIFYALWLGIFWWLDGFDLMAKIGRALMPI